MEEDFIEQGLRRVLEGRCVNCGLGIMPTPQEIDEGADTLCSFCGTSLVHEWSNDTE